MTAWLLLAFDPSDVQTAGTIHYADELRTVYRYDSRVHNQRQVSVGDTVVVRNKHSLVGFAKVERIESIPGTKHLFRCPECESTNIKRRKSKRPLYKCQKCRNEFERAREEMMPCTQFSAYFGDTFIDAENALSVDTLRQACVNYNGFLSMQKLDVSRLMAGIQAHAPQAARYFTIASHSLADSEGAEEFSPTDQDSRETIFQQIKERRGQGAFRRGLLDRQGPFCMITGSAVVAVLEAAHIAPYRGIDDNDPANGLILRSDLHTLFDLNLLGINPESLEIDLHSNLRQSEYGQFQGSRIRFKLRPSKAALSKRWIEYRQIFGSTLLEDEPQEIG